MINKDFFKFPNVQKTNRGCKYILITSLNLGGAEKIVSDQLWANYYSNNPDKITLIIIYNKEKEHSIPPDVNLIRLNNKIENGEVLFKQIAFENETLVSHLINDGVLNYLFSLNVKVTLVMHNDKMGWLNSNEIFSHKNIVKLVAICDFVKKQLQEITNKKIITLRHQIDYKKNEFNPQIRKKIREELKINDDDVVIGMVGRIAQQKNYLLAIDILNKLCEENKKYKLIILGGFEKGQTHYYLSILNKINGYGLQKNVFLLGFKNNVSDYINAFDIGMNSSDYEGLSMATQELIGNGLYVVATKVCGQPEIYDKNKQLKFISSELMNENKIESFVNEIQKINNRFLLTDDDFIENKKIRYFSQQMWKLINYTYQSVGDEKNTLFLTSNLNLGGAQKSLCNLLIDFKSKGFDVSLCVANQSNIKLFSNLLFNYNIDFFVAEKSQDVYDILINVFYYIKTNKVGNVVFWNVDAKLKLLLSKILEDNVKIIDVSPGDYCLEELKNQKIFQEGIYFYDYNYLNIVNSFVSKYDNTESKYLFKEFLQNKTKVIQNGVFFNENNLKSDFNNIPEKILVCGRIVPSKYSKEIVNVFKKLLEKNNNLKLYFVGSSDEYYRDYNNEVFELSKELLNKNIFFLGNIDEPMLVMKDYDLLITLGKHQGCPNIILEAVSVGLPIIANDSGGTKEILKNSNLLNESFTEDELLINLEYCYDNYNIFKEQSLLNLSHIKHNFTMDKMSASYIKLLKP